MNYGQIAYEAYCKSSGGKSLISGAELPPWVNLSLEIQRAWNAAADAVNAKSWELTKSARKGFNEAIEGGRK